jgi:hypothetical protein
MAQIHWASAVSADFSTLGDWTGGVVPGPSDDAILDATGGAFTVTVSTNTAVNSIQTAAAAILSISGGTFTASNGSGSGANAGSIVVGDDTTFDIGGDVDNSGVILLDSAGDSTNLEILSGQNLTLTGGGTVRLSDNGANTIDALAAGSTLTNVDNKIVGVGQLGSANLTIVNDSGAKIKANGALPLVVSAPNVTNGGAIRAAAGGNLILENTTVNNGAGGHIKVNDGAQISLQSADIIGGTIVTLGSGVVQTTDSGSTLDGSTFTVNNDGLVEIDDNTGLTILGAINNVGTIALGANFGGATLTLASDTTLSGGGQVTLTDSTGNLITGGVGVSLTNVDNTISGAGRLGGKELTITNQALGVIDAGGTTNRLVINTGSSAIENAGLIEATGAAGGQVKSAVVNDGTLEANGGALTFTAAVTGSGQAVIESGSLVFKSSFSQNVTFTGPSGVLKLFDSKSYTGTVTGFSLTGGTSLDLRDVGFVSAGEATFVDNGHGTGGVLTVTDGVNTAHINLVGDYTASTFVASSDGAGGVIVVDPTASQSNAASSLFTQAMASLGTNGVGDPAVLSVEDKASQSVLTVPRFSVH